MMEKTKGVVDNLLGGLPELSPKAARSPPPDSRRLIPRPTIALTEQAAAKRKAVAQKQVAEAAAAASAAEMAQAEMRAKAEAAVQQAMEKRRIEAEAEVCVHCVAPPSRAKRPASANRPRHTPTGTCRGRACRCPRGASGGGAPGRARGGEGGGGDDGRSRGAEQGGGAGPAGGGDHGEASLATPCVLSM